MPTLTASDLACCKCFREASHVANRPAADQAWEAVRDVLKGHPQAGHEPATGLNETLVAVARQSWWDLAQAMVEAGVTGGPEASRVMRILIRSDAVAVAQALLTLPDGLPGNLDIDLYEMLELAIQRPDPQIAPLLLAHTESDLEAYLVEALSEGESPLHQTLMRAILPRVDLDSEEGRAALLYAVQKGHFQQVALIWAQTTDLDAATRQHLAKAAAAHGQGAWVARFTEDAPASVDLLVEAMRHQQGPLARELWDRLPPPQRMEAWTTLVGAREWVALDTLSPVVPASWRHILIEWAGPDQAPQAVAHERHLHLQTRPAPKAATRRRT